MSMFKYGGSLGSKALICMQTAARFGCLWSRDSENEDWKQDNKLCSFLNTYSSTGGHSLHITVSILNALQMTHIFTCPKYQMINQLRQASVFSINDGKWKTLVSVPPKTWAANLIELVRPN